jgi:hypothetical protein
MKKRWRFVSFALVVVLALTALFVLPLTASGDSNLKTHVVYQNAEGKTLGAFDAPFRNPDFKRDRKSVV